MKVTKKRTLARVLCPIFVKDIILKQHNTISFAIILKKETTIIANYSLFRERVFFTFIRSSKGKLGDTEYLGDGQFCEISKLHNSDTNKHQPNTTRFD